MYLLETINHIRLECDRLRFYLHICMNVNEHTQLKFWTDLRKKIGTEYYIVCVKLAREKWNKCKPVD